MDSPKVSFIIAHHNYHQYLGNAIDSALNQTYKNIHICVIDDCSNNQDEVLRIIKEKNSNKDWSSVEIKNNGLLYSSDNFTFVQLSKESGSYHQSYARNRGIEAVWDFTDIFAILDADDENYPEKIEKSVNLLLSDMENIGAVYTDTDIIQVSNDRIVREFREPFDYYRLIQECIVHSGCVITKKALSSVMENGKVLDEDLPVCEDYDLWIRIAEKFFIFHIPEPLVLVRVHPQNSTNTTTHEYRMSKLIRVHEKRNSRLNAKPHSSG